MEIEAAFYDEDNISDDLLISFEQEFVPYWKLREALRANPEKVGKGSLLKKRMSMQDSLFLPCPTKENASQTNTVRITNLLFSKSILQS